MKRNISFFLCAGCLLITAHRLPAPIQEVPESPTPTATPALQLAPIPLASPTPTATPSPQLAPIQLPRTAPGHPKAVRFAGTWSGRIRFGNAGNVDFTLVVNSEATSLQQKSKNFGDVTHLAVVTGRTLSWQAGRENRIAWTLTPNPNGQTALVTSKSASGVVTSAVFQRGQPSVQPAPALNQKHPGTKVKHPPGN